jgi:hypothetical protein
MNVLSPSASVSSQSQVSGVRLHSLIQSLVSKIMADANDPCLAAPSAPSNGVPTALDLCVVIYIHLLQHGNGFCVVPSTDVIDCTTRVGDHTKVASQYAIEVESGGRPGKEVELYS